MKFEFSEMLWSVWESERFQRFLYWLFFTDNPAGIVRLYDEAIEDFQNQIAEKNMAIDGLLAKSSQYQKELTLKGDQVMHLKYELLHLQAQINGLESEKQNLQEVLDDNEKIIFDLQARVRDLQADLTEAKARQVNVQQVEELEGLLRYYQMQCRELQRQAGPDNPAIQPAQDGGYNPRNMPLI